MSVVTIEVSGYTWRTGAGIMRDHGLKDEGFHEDVRSNHHQSETHERPTCVRNLRLTVRRVLQIVAEYPDRAELAREYPELEDEDIRQALLFAAASVDDRVVERVIPS